MWDKEKLISIQFFIDTEAHYVGVVLLVIQYKGGSSAGTPGLKFFMGLFLKIWLQNTHL